MRGIIGASSCACSLALEWTVPIGVSSQREARTSMYRLGLQLVQLFEIGGPLGTIILMWDIFGSCGTSRALTRLRTSWW